MSTEGVLSDRAIRKTVFLLMKIDHRALIVKKGKPSEKINLIK